MCKEVGYMEDGKISVFDIVLLVVGISVVFLGFQLINKAYKAEQSQFGWLMIIAIFSWLTLMILFILLSVMVDVSKKELSTPVLMFIVLGAFIAFVLIIVAIFGYGKKQK